ncbi:E3 ubiquitin-protein ligase RNF10 [Arctopsyche grandis]|uniref:E3 ubiquitin-protein ligase RNF10 n=1 Tax=Arctopsyche grandis TaxID=121162 RepID=UPI00406DA173
MEKKQPVKGSVDFKRTDTYNSKACPRPKKRESPVNVPTKSENGRKQNAPRGKSYDKRPRPRGSYRECAMGGKEDSRLEESNAEVGSVFLPGSKKHNLNHLLNFHYAPRDANRQSSNRGNRKPHGLIYTNTHKHNKELFLQSNCQFVVKSDGDYTPYLVDPDIPICWDFIEQINVRVSEPLTCPICLGETVAGRITRCGHTYCWPCLLRYFSLAEETSRPCPICFQPIDRNNLKSVQGVWHNHVPVGDEITMKLMRRKRGSTFVELAPPLGPVLNPMQKSADRLFSVSEQEPSTLFSKLLSASPREVIEIILRERHELNSELSDDLEHPEFILEALHLLDRREAALPAVNVVEDIIVEDKPSAIQIDAEPENIVNINNDPEIFTFDNCSNTLNDSVNNIDELSPVIVTENSPNIETDSIIEKPNVNDNCFYFYQAADGQAIFLHGLDIRIIEASWGSLSLAPRELKGIILERASGSVGAECRRRLRCLQHLPIHCPYDFVEVNLKPPFVTHDALKLFKGELEDRKRHRHKRARDEKRRERVISQKEQVIMGHIPSLEININSEVHFPAYQPDLELTPPASDWKWEGSVDSSPGPSSDGGVSFAKMASAEGTWKARPARPLPTAVKIQSDCDDSENECAPPSEFNFNIADYLSAAVTKVAISSAQEESSNKDGKKKKKHKAKVLFTTGIQHRTTFE